MPVTDDPGRRHLRSAARGDIALTRTNTKTLGRRSFAVYTDQSSGMGFRALSATLNCH